MTKNKLQKFFLTTTVFIFAFCIKANAASFDFNPSSGDLTAGCVHTLVIDIDAAGENVNAADIEINWNPAEVEIIDSDSNISGTQIGVGNAFEAYFGNQVDASNEIIRLAGGSFTGSLSSKKTFATIKFRSKTGITSTDFDIRFDGVGDTLDSNIADASTSNDLLTSATDGSYIFSPPEFGSCQSDTQAPAVTFVSPSSGQNGVPANASIEIKITDNISGVDLNSLTFYLNGEEYKVSDPEVSYSGTPNNYTFTIIPRTNNQIMPDVANTLRVTGQDNAGNTFNRQIVFNVPGVTQAPLPTPPPAPTCPVCDGKCEDLSCEEPTMVICHQPGTTAEKTMTINQTALNEHLDHGDQIGACGDDAIDCNTFISEETITEEIANEACETIVDTVESSITNIPFIKDFLENKMSNLTTNAILTGAASLSLLPAAGFLTTPGLLLNLMAFLVGKRHKKPWGIIIDAATEKPIPFAICKLYEAGTAKMIDQTISDSEGRYGFTITAGSYRLEITKPSYEKQIIKFAINETEAGYVQDIKLVPSNLKAKIKQGPTIFKTIWKGLGNIYARIFPLIFLAGFMSASISSYIDPSILNIIILSLYLISTAIYLYSKTDVKTKYSTVIDSSSTLRLPNALIKIFDINSGELIDTKLTSNDGYFDFWGEPGEYNIHTSLRGYKFPSEVQTDLQKVFVNETPMLKLKLKKGRNKYRLLVDPI